MFESLQSLAKGLFSIRAIQGLSYTVHTCTWASLGNFFVHLVPHFKSRNDVLHCVLWLRCILTMLLSLFYCVLFLTTFLWRQMLEKERKTLGWSCSAATYASHTQDRASHEVFAKALWNLIKFHPSIDAPPKGKRTSTTRLGLIHHIIIHTQHYWTTTWSRAGGDTIYGKLQKPRDRGGEGRVGSALCSILVKKKHQIC